VAELQLPKLIARVRFPSLAPWCAHELVPDKEFCQLKN
jgi:hypothetical protein